MKQTELFTEHLPAHCQPLHATSVPAAGEQLKRQGMDKAASAHAAELAHARVVARCIAENKGTVTADDVANAIGRSLGNAAGSFFTGGDFEWTGERIKSVRPESHNNELRVWRLRISERE